MPGKLPMGTFKLDESCVFFEKLPGAAIRLVRIDIQIIFCWVEVGKTADDRFLLFFTTSNAHCNSNNNTTKMSDTWRENLLGEKKEFDRLQAMDAALDEDQIAADIDKILSQKRNKSIGGESRKSEGVSSAHNLEDEGNESAGQVEENVHDLDVRDKFHSNQNYATPATPEVDRAPETADRYFSDFSSLHMLIFDL